MITCSFVGTAIAIFVGALGPAEKWQQLRLAECAVRSEVWKFRTRSGAYNMEDEHDRHAEQLLAENIAKIKREVMGRADMEVT